MLRVVYRIPDALGARSPGEEGCGIDESGARLLSEGGYDGAAAGGGTAACDG